MNVPREEWAIDVPLPKFHTFVSPEYATFPTAHVMTFIEQYTKPTLKVVYVTVPNETYKRSMHGPMRAQLETLLPGIQVIVLVVDAASATETPPHSIVIHWNPIVKRIQLFGELATGAFSVLLTNALLNTNKMFPAHEKAPMCVGEAEYDETATYVKIDGSNVLAYANVIAAAPPGARFLLCFPREVTEAEALLNYRLATIFMGRRGDELTTFSTNATPRLRNITQQSLRYETFRRVLLADQFLLTCEGGGLLRTPQLRWLTMAKIIMRLPSAMVLKTMLSEFKKLIGRCLIVPDIIQNIVGLEQLTDIRLTCPHDSFSVTPHGLVPANLPNINPKRAQTPPPQSDRINKYYSLFKTTAVAYQLKPVIFNYFID